VIEQVAKAVEPDEPEVGPQVAPKQHIYFPSSSDDGSVPPDDDSDGDDDDAADDADDATGDDPEQTVTAFRSDYVGRGNVQAVRAARKHAGLDQQFPRSDRCCRNSAEASF